MTGAMQKEGVTAPAAAGQVAGSLGLISQSPLGLAGRPGGDQAWRSVQLSHGGRAVAPVSLCSGTTQMSGGSMRDFGPF